MNEMQDKNAGAMRIFEALSSVDEELLERSGTSRRVILFGRITKVLGVCACFVILGFVTWYGSRIFLTKGSYDCGGTENQMLADAEVGYKEEAAVEEAVIEDAVIDDAAVEEAENDMAMPETVITENSSSKEHSYVSDSAPLAIEQDILSEAEIREGTELAKYVPEVIPQDYAFESGSRTEDGSLYARWSRGMDDIVVSVTWYERDMENQSRIADITKPETYDVHLYDIPYAQTVPEEYWTVFNNPIFLEKDFTEDMVSARMKNVADSGDTDTPRGRFSVLYESGVLVTFNGDCDAEAVWRMFTSIGQ